MKGSKQNIVDGQTFERGAVTDHRKLIVNELFEKFSTVTSKSFGCASPMRATANRPKKPPSVNMATYIIERGRSAVFKDITEYQ